MIYANASSAAESVSNVDIRQTAPGARFVVAGGTVAERRSGNPDQPLVLKNHDFMAMPAEERGIENIGNSPVELVEIELK
jgi:hypothetical protein